MGRSIIVSLWLLAVLATPASSGEPDLAERIRAEARDRERRVVGLYRVRLSSPQRLSGGVSAMVVRQPKAFECNAVCEYRGLVVQAEPGIGGGQLGLGYAVVMGEKRPDRRFLSRVYMGYGLKATVMRGWGDSPLNPDDQTLLGVEADFTVIGVNFSLALLRHVGTGRPDDDWVVGGGVGWGF